MLFDPKIKHNGKIRNIQLVDPSKIVLKDFETIKNNFKPGDSLLINDSDSITEAIAKLDESLHPRDESLEIDIESMKNLYPENIVDESISNPFDGMKIIFNRPLNYYRDKNTINNAGNVKIAICFTFSNDGSDKEYWKIITIDCRHLSMSSRTIIYSEFLPTYVGDYELSEFQFFYLIIEPYVSNSNFITIYKTNLIRIGIGNGIGRSIC